MTPGPSGGTPRTQHTQNSDSARRLPWRRLAALTSNAGSAAGAAGAAGAASSAPAGRSRSRRGRLATGAGVSVSVFSLAAAAVFATAPQAVTAVLHGVSAWLADDHTGAVVQVDGQTGKPYAAVKVADEPGDRLEVYQSGSTVFVRDLTTGQVNRIDPSSLTVTASARLPSTGTDIVVGGSAAYLVDSPAGFVQGLDPATLALAGPRVGAPALVARLGAAQLAPDATLWVADDGDGRLVPVRHGVAGTPVPIGGRGDTLLMSLADGRPVVTDATDSTVEVLSADGAGPVRAIRIPGAAGSGSPVAGIAQPADADGTVVPLALSPRGVLILVDTARGAATSVTLPAAAGDRLEAPQVLGRRVYVPDETRGELLVYDTVSGRSLGSVPVGAPGGEIDAFVQDGVLFADAPAGADAVCIGPDGLVHQVDKDPGALPAASASRSTAAPGAVPSAPPAEPGSQPGDAGTGGPVGRPGPSLAPAAPPASSSRAGAGQPSSAPPPKPSPTQVATTPAAPPAAPGSVTETPQAGSIVVTFSPDPAGAAQYTLTGVPAGASVSPGVSIPAAGPVYRFQVSGLSCDQPPYVFGVTAQSAAGSATTPAAAGARPCLAPGQPGPLSTATSDGSIALTWGAAAGNGGTVTYLVSWSGGSATTSSTSYTISGLAIDQTYDVSVVARNGAGQGPAATASVDLSDPHDYRIYNDWKDGLYLESVPQANHHLYYFPAEPQGSGQTVTVLCQTGGDPVQDPVDAGLHGSIWDLITYAGHTGYVSDLYVETPESVAGDYSSYSSALWRC